MVAIPTGVIAVVHTHSQQTHYASPLPSVVGGIRCGPTSATLSGMPNYGGTPDDPGNVLHLSNNTTAMTCTAAGDATTNPGPSTGSTDPVPAALTGGPASSDPPNPHFAASAFASGVELYAA